ncbi:O-methyltransferase [Spirosoma utsteinense]|uniref:O-methyltransferase YrrM n=1 Tax=Spirosoma utsteinense TaxID=2585773 RepID=A0ABR6W8B3_9BACT|nr:class I SAM-dependent methyltransferase [Spirosoma utsteinense]MBC3784159.1 putative O-methyltransferase YrrM [Spirosoma utsteinense]MBC3792752.1 putative O-methyltransferase YrrM [Spirosoma utsteinense]
MINDQINLNEPASYDVLWQETVRQQFGMPSDKLTGSLLRMLAGTKPNGTFLELGTGTGMATCWLLDGMHADSTLITVDNDEKPLAVARQYLGADPRLTIHLANGETIIDSLPTASVDLIFADAWPGKYNHLTEALALLKVGGIYLIDDMLPQPNWPDGHSEKADRLVEWFEASDEFAVTKMNWSTGLILAVKK